MIRMTVAAIAATLSVSAVQAEEGPYHSEAAARVCIHARLAALVKQEHPGNISGDTALSACTTDLKAELKEKKKSYCQAMSYIGWLVADENSKLNGVSGRPYTPDKGFLQNCEKSQNWEKHREAPQPMKNVWPAPSASSFRELI